MKQLPLPYLFVRPPKAVRKATLDNVALVPASLLPRKGKYQTIANNLPSGGVLICQIDKEPRLRAILARVASFLRENGHFVRTLPYSLMEEHLAFCASNVVPRLCRSIVTHERHLYALQALIDEHEVRGARAQEF